MEAPAISAAPVLPPTETQEPESSVEAGSTPPAAAPEGNEGGIAGHESGPEPARGAPGQPEIASAKRDDAAPAVPADKVTVQHNPRDKSALIKATGNNDEILLERGPTGSWWLPRAWSWLWGNESVTAKVNGEDHGFKAEEIDRIVIEGGAGDDLISARGREGNEGSGDLGTIVRVAGGAGNDTFFDSAAEDYFSGEQGDDIFHGSLGNDVAYGGRGFDKLDDDAGFNYLDGGKDADSIATGASTAPGAGPGKSVISGGPGDDLIESRGFDTVYPGQGADAVRNFAHQDKIYAPAGEDRLLTGSGDELTQVIDTPYASGAGGSLQVGDPDVEFAERIADDFETFRASPAGAKLLGALDAHRKPEHDVRIYKLPLEYGGGDLTSVPSGAALVPIAQDTAGSTGKPGVGGVPDIDYNPGGNLDGRFNAGQGPIPLPPALGLFHELVHAHGDLTGTLQPGRYLQIPAAPNDLDGFLGTLDAERQAIGLPLGGPGFDPDGAGIRYDHDGNPDTPLTTDNPWWAMENTLRAEWFQWPLRANFNESGPG